MTQSEKTALIARILIEELPNHNLLKIVEIAARIVEELNRYEH